MTYYRAILVALVLYSTTVTASDYQIIDIGVTSGPSQFTFTTKLDQFMHIPSMEDDDLFATISQLTKVADVEIVLHANSDTTKRVGELYGVCT